MILENYTSEKTILQSQIEMVEQQKQEYYFLGSFIRTAGLKIYSYNHFEDKVEELKIKYNSNVYTEMKDGKLMPLYLMESECMIDSRFTVFEALNMQSAINRVQRYKNGSIVELCNLRKPNPNGMKLKFW